MTARTLIRSAFSAVSFACAALFFTACHDASPKTEGAAKPGPASTNVPDYRADLPVDRLEPLQAAVLASKPADREALATNLKAAWSNLSTAAQLESAYWTTLAYKYLRTVTPADEFRAKFGELEKLNFYRVSQEAVLDAAERIAAAGGTNLALGLGVVTGLRQFGTANNIDDDIDASLDRIYFWSERRSLRALLDTNAVLRHFLRGMDELKVKAYDIPLNTIRKIYIYEQGGVTYDFFKMQRLTNLEAIKAEFDPAERWIFTNIRWPDISRPHVGR